MCEPIFTLCESETSIFVETCQPVKPSTLPVCEEDCKCPKSGLAQYTHQIQYRIAKDAKNNAANRESFEDCTKYTLQHLPDYHNLDTNALCGPESLAPEIYDCTRDAGLTQDRCLANAGARFVTLRIENDPGSDDYEPMMIDVTYPGLAAYVRKILEGDSARNAIYGINFEPYYPKDKKSKRNPYEVLHPSVIENLLNKLFSRSDLTPEDITMFSKFINIAGRLNAEDLNAYFCMLRARGVVLADVVDNFRKQFWQLKSVIMSRNDVENFLKKVKRAVLFGDPKEAKKRKAQSVKRLAQALEDALEQAEQWAKDLLSKKLTWSTGKTLSDTGKGESRAEAKPSATALTKPSPGKQMEISIKKDTDPKLTKKENLPKDQSGDIPGKKEAESSPKKDDSTNKKQTPAGKGQKSPPEPAEKKDGASTQKGKDAKAKKEKSSIVEKAAVSEREATSERPTTQEEKSRRTSLKGKEKAQKSPATTETSRQDSVPITPIAIGGPPKSEEDKTGKDSKTRGGTSKSGGTSKGTSEGSPRATSPEPALKKINKVAAVSNIIQMLKPGDGEQKDKKKGDSPWNVDSKAIDPKSEFYKDEGGLDPQTDAISTRSIRTAREPERDFRMRLAAALSAATKYSEKTLYIPDPHGVEDTPRSTKRFTATDVLESDGKALMRRSASRVYNDSSQLFERYSFLTTGAHQAGYYEPWDVEFPWEDLQEIVANMTKLYVKRMPDPNFSYRRGMEYYQSMFRRELEEQAEKEKKALSKKGK